ncbi:probable serine/threonine-protein kinase kinX isoform X3 [Culex pipiens pallens]|uniref:probable serine/threonine-protein kinase kinX isoform X4 n=1 Tax=Culex pipiens pallens TaxID=42434 RepID=UPI0022AAFC61|nr:probable serine/threonine-protein kinase kinX isoform X4 [Culex pipiens pallens]XP_039434501.2 probable serine/threonine-protein kinase kinX isoform X3 [Culex pipiens pallens]
MARLSVWVLAGLALFALAGHELHVNADTPTEYECRPYIEKAIQDLKTGTDATASQEEEENVTTEEPSSTESPVDVTSQEEEDNTAAEETSIEEDVPEKTEPLTASEEVQEAIFDNAAEQAEQEEEEATEEEVTGSEEGLEDEDELTASEEEQEQEATEEATGSEEETEDGEDELTASEEEQEQEQEQEATEEVTGSEEETEDEEEEELTASEEEQELEQEATEEATGSEEETEDEDDEEQLTESEEAAAAASDNEQDDEESATESQEDVPVSGEEDTETDDDQDDEEDDTEDQEDDDEQTLSGEEEQEEEEDDEETNEEENDEGADEEDEQDQDDEEDDTEDQEDDEQTLSGEEEEDDEETDQEEEEDEENQDDEDDEEQADEEEASAEQHESDDTDASPEAVDATEASQEQEETEELDVEESTEAVEEVSEELAVEEETTSTEASEQTVSEETELDEPTSEEVVEPSAEETETVETADSLEASTEPASEELSAVEEEGSEEVVASEEAAPASEEEPAPVESAEEAEPLPEEDLLLEYEIPTNRRDTSHIYELLNINDESADKEAALHKVADVILRDLKKTYDTAIKPLETLYKYRDLSNRHFGDPEIFSKPLILFMGPWSGGKSTILNYLTKNEYTPNSVRTGAEPSPAYFNILMHGDEPEVLDGTQLAADWTFSGLQKFGQGLLDRLRGQKLPNKLLERVNIVEIPGILEVRKQVSQYFPFNDACQWFIDRADIIFLVYDPSKLDVGPETEAILDQLKGREYQTRILLNKADQVKPEELLRVQGALIWNISPLMSSAQPPVMYTVSLWSNPFETGAPTRLLQAQERSLLLDLGQAIEKRIENKIASARRFAVRVRNHAKMVDCYLTTYYNHKTLFANKKYVSDQIIGNPQQYHIYEGLSTLTNISRYDLPDPESYRDFFQLNPLYEFQKLSETCTYFRGCPINKLDIAIAYDLPELVGKYKKLAEAALEKLQIPSQTTDFGRLKASS